MANNFHFTNKSHQTEDANFRVVYAKIRLAPRPWWWHCGQHDLHSNEAD